MKIVYFFSFYIMSILICDECKMILLNYPEIEDD